ncbi:hypothetical protein F4560_005225 [Saccharothrix ecbatanensis]|jgi:hypothetical protein|uniref:Uncharacterized protein n=1 Tax=Saccharothrix ecbatanensis TaxID=1105145 RepID=A0A7W9HNC0_9PSEU|nr:hypothetical protein [Saccharothrix ecbatanensis]MBB5805457.1 hypothetical protein [Saccharothrix ecbatanensis]
MARHDPNLVNRIDTVEEGIIDAGTDTGGGGGGAEPTGGPYKPTGDPLVKPMGGPYKPTGDEPVAVTPTN